MATFGIIGLGRIGGGLALQAIEKGHRVHGFDPGETDPALAAAGLVRAESLAELVAGLPASRILFLYVHAGPTVEALREELRPLLDPADILVDGGNSYWGDAVRRQAEEAAHGIHWVDLGTSGGLVGARTGACFMLGGDPAAKARVAPILHDLCVPGGFVDAGGPGAGHFVKLVHNGIEFGMLQAIGEGIELLEKYPREKLPVADILGCYQNGSVIRSWLVDLMAEAYVQDGIENVPGFIEDTGEVNWLVSDALEMEAPIPVIAQSVMQLFQSRDDRRNWARAVAMMRRGFGGHPYGPKPSIAEERRISRVGDIYRQD